MNILVVGGAGYIGGALTDILQKNTSYNVLVYDNLVYEKDYLKNVNFIYGDVRDYTLLQQYLDWADIVVWLAALVGDPACQVNPEVTVDINRNAVKYLSENFDGRIIYMSTCSVYGAMQGEISDSKKASLGILDENAPMNPLSVYAVTKMESEAFLKHKNAVIFRLGTLHGMSDRYSRIRLDLVLNILTLKAHHLGKLNVFGGEQYRPLLHVRDVAKAIVANIETYNTGIYNLAKENVKIIDLAQKVIEYFPNAQLEITDISFEDSRNYSVSWQKAVSDFGFNPQLTIDDTVKELIEIFKQGRIKDVNDARYSNGFFLNQHRPAHVFNP